MKRNGVVSVWVGSGQGRANFDRFLEYRIVNDEFDASPFCKAIGVEQYDPDYFGGTYFPKPIKLDLLLRETDILGEVKARAITVPSSNCVVMFYDHEFDGKSVDFELSDFHFVYLGCFKTKHGRADNDDPNDKRQSQTGEIR